MLLLRLWSDDPVSESEGQGAEDPTVEESDDGQDKGPTDAAVALLMCGKNISVLRGLIYTIYVEFNDIIFMHFKMLAGIRSSYPYFLFLKKAINE